MKEEQNLKNEEIKEETTPLESLDQQVESSTSPQENIEQASTVVSTPSSQKQVTKVVEEVKTKEKGGNFKYVMTVFLFIALLVLIYFLPDISEKIKNYKAEQNQLPTTKVPVIQSGVMSCSLKKSTDTKTVTAITEFKFTKLKLKSTTTETTTVLKEDATGEDLTTLDTMQTSCIYLESVAKGVTGMRASCTKTARLQTTKEVIDYTKLDLQFIKENIAEFEGIYPEFKRNQNIDEIESLMEAAGYTCEKK